MNGDLGDRLLDQDTAEYAGNDEDVQAAAPGNPFLKPAPGAGSPANPFSALAAAKLIKANKRQQVIASFTRPSDVNFSPQVEHALQHAGIYLREGEMHLKFMNHPQTPSQIKHTLILHSARYCYLELIFALLYLLLTIIEYPSAIDNVPLWVPCTIEVICLAFFVVNLILRSRCSGREFSFKTHPAYTVRAVVVALLLLDLGLTIAYPEHPRFVRLVRPILVLDAEYAAPVRRICRQILETTYRILDMLILLVLYILIWSVLGFYFFSNNPDDPYFRDLASSYMSLFILMTTANYPDVMMPAYYNNQFACIFFILYMLFGFYFLLSIVLSMVYEGYTHATKKKYKKVWFHQRKAAKLCYTTALADEPEGASLTFPKFYKICKYYRDDMTAKHIYLCYRALDRDLDGSIDLSEFNHIFDVVQVGYFLNVFETFGTVRGPVRWHQRLGSPWDKHFKRLAMIVEHVVFEYVIDVVILINTVFVVIKAAEQDYGHPDNFHTTTAEWAFFAIYAIEAIAKLLAAGFKLYFENNWNKFDFGVVFVSFVGIVVQESTSTAKSSQMTVFIRSLRLLRLIRIRQTFRSVVAGMGYMIPKMGRFLASLAIVYYVFAIIGMGCFNDTVSRCSPYSGIDCLTDASNSIIPACTSQGLPCDVYNSNKYAAYNYTALGAGQLCGCCAPAGLNCGSEYAEPYAVVGPPHNNGAGYYQLNNFDDVLRSYVTLFEQMIVNNWFVAMNGHVYMTSEYARIYFILFYLFAVQVVTNIIVSFVIDSFMGVFPILKARKKGELLWSRAYNEKVAIGMDEARKMFEPDDIDLFQPVPELVYTASSSISASDIDRILFADEIQDWREEELDSLPEAADDKGIGPL